MKSSIIAVVLALFVSVVIAGERFVSEPAKESSKMGLGAFSISLAVKDLEASRTFYSKLGFEPVGGDPAQNWQILRNGTTTIGLSQGMFERDGNPILIDQHVPKPE